MTREKFTPCYCCEHCDILTPQEYPFINRTCGYCMETQTVIFPYDLKDDTEECPYCVPIGEPERQYASYLFPDYSNELAKLTAVRHG